jgi:hypothetical protein
MTWHASLILGSAYGGAWDPMMNGDVQHSPKENQVDHNPFAPPTSTVADPSVDLANLREIASAQRKLILCVLAGLLVNIFLRGNSAISIIQLIAFMIVAIFSGVCVYALCQSLGISPWPWVAAAFIPIVNLIGLVALNQKATSRLRAEGIKVGFLGANLK